MGGSSTRNTKSRRIPVWRQIEAALREDLGNGTFAPGNRLPAEPELVARFGVNRLTIRQALSALQLAGYIRIERGRGTYVQDRPLPYGLGERVSFSDNLLAAKRLPSRRLIESKEVPADAACAGALGIEPKSPLVMIAVVGDADGVPVLFGLNHYPAARFRGLDKMFQIKGSLSKALASFEVEYYRRRSTEMLARLPTPLEARHLAQPRTRPVIETRSVDVDPEGVPISFGITCFAADRIKFVLGS